MMFGSLILLAASIAQPASPARSDAGFTPRGGATARASVSVRVISGASFGPATLSGADGASRRKAQIVDANGAARAAELLEFQ